MLRTPKRPKISKSNVHIEGSKVKGANFSFGQIWHFVFFQTYKVPFICGQNFKFNFIPYMGKIERIVLSQLPLETIQTGKRFQVHLVPSWQQMFNILQWKKVPSLLGTFYPWNNALFIQQTQVLQSVISFFQWIL